VVPSRFCFFFFFFFVEEIFAKKSMR